MTRLFSYDILEGMDKMEVKMLSEFKCKKCGMTFVVALMEIEAGKPIRHCVCCGNDDLEFLGNKTESYPKLGQDNIRDVFAAGQNVLVRDGTEWHTREIMGITVLRHDTQCPHCGIPLLGEPRFWFKGCVNIPLEEIMAKEDIDPTAKPTPGLILGKPLASPSRLSTP